MSIGVEVGIADNDVDRSTAWIDGFAILIAVVLSSSVQAANDYQKEKQFRHLNQIADENKMVIFSFKAKYSFKITIFCFMNH